MPPTSPTDRRRSAPLGNFSGLYCKISHKQNTFVPRRFQGQTNHYFCPESRVFFERSPYEYPGHQAVRMNCFDLFQGAVFATKSRGSFERSRAFYGGSRIYFERGSRIYFERGSRIYFERGSRSLFPQWICFELFFSRNK
jgi:hypothetical protein